MLRRPLCLWLLMAACVLLASRCDAPEAERPASSDLPAHAETSNVSLSPADTTEPPPLDVRALERAVHRAANRARRAEDRAPLAWSDSLRRLARRHSRDMARRDYFAHVSPEGTDPATRAVRLGFPTARTLSDGRRIGIGENLFRTGRYAQYRDVYRQRGAGPRRHVRRVYQWKERREIAQETVEGWLDSPPHRRALLSPAFRKHGFGVALTEDHVYVTQNLF